MGIIIRHSLQYYYGGEASLGWTGVSEIIAESGQRAAT